MKLLRLQLGGHDCTADPACGVSLAIPLLFNGPQPAFFGATAAAATPLESSDFRGDTRFGGSCNVARLQLTPHCNGTHTECIGHITDDAVAVTDQLHGGWLPATLASLTPNNNIIDAGLIRTSLQRHPLPEMRRAFIIRTLPNGRDKLTRDYDAAPPPHITESAAMLLVEAGVEHLLVDLPSLDPMHDQGRLAAHRAFWGLPIGSRRLADAKRPGATVTELIYVPDKIADGYYLLDLQIPAFMSDAAPSRPIIYPLDMQ